MIVEFNLTVSIKTPHDFNGDGKADILWRHAVTGRNRIYLMNGATIVTNTVVNRVADLNWQIVP